MMFRLAGMALLILMVSLLLDAQEPVVREQTAGNVISFEHHVIAEDTVRRLIIPFRIRYDFFVFVRSVTAGTEAFTAGGEVSAELIDSTGTSTARTIERIDLSVLRNIPTELRSQFYQNFISFPVQPGRYTIVFSLQDKESKRKITDDRRTLTVPPGTETISGLIPVQKNGDTAFTLFNLGGDVLFSQDYGFLFQSAKQYTSAEYTLRKLMPDEDEYETIAANASIPVERYALQTYRTVRGSAVEMILGNSSSITTHFIRLNGSQLRQGRYELVLKFPDSTSVKTVFGARWLDMPVSLNDLDLAIEPLQFIMTKNDYSDLRRGSRDSRIRKFEEFWKKKDSSPSTVYNEVMHEFYRRVDYAVTAYRTLREMNGAITDRGRVYLLYGNPSTTERLLAPDGAPKEIWKYNSLNKVFTFEDPSKQGNYKLAEQE